MAEQNTEDTNTPVVRRGARPFAGPAGAASAARPLLRPAATPARGRAPFAPPLSPDRIALGAVRTPTPPVMVPFAPYVRVAAPIAEPIAEIIAQPVETPVAEALIETSSAIEELDSAPASAPDHLDFGFPMPSLDEQPMVPELVAEPEMELDAPLPLSPRPITSEMIALDAFTAFDSVWGPGNTPAASPVIESHPAPDAESLGSASTADTWADEITAGPAHHTTESVEPTSDADVADSPWARATTPNSAFPAWLINDEAETPAVVAEPSPELSAQAPEAELADAPVQALEAPQNDSRGANELRVSAALDRLAERIRGGEIDVSSVAPEAPDAAVLASVLAAILGGSHSR